MAERAVLPARARNVRGAGRPLEREEFLGLDRLRIDVAAVELSSALGRDTAVRDRLRLQLARVFDHQRPASRL